MVYSPEEKQRMDRLVAAFSGFIAASEDIDVAYTDKTGYIRLIVAEYADWIFMPIRGFDDMLDMFFFDIFTDEVIRVLQKNPDFCYSMVDSRLPYEQLRTILNTLDEDREYCLNELEKYKRRWELEHIGR